MIHSLVWLIASPWAPIFEIVGVATVLWWARVWVMAPWARYVAHSTVLDAMKQRRYFMTITRHHWWPPFAEYQETLFCVIDRYGDPFNWVRESDGVSFENRKRELSSMLDAARVREIETQELSK